MFTFDDLLIPSSPSPTRIQQPNGSRELPFLVEENDNPFLRQYVEHSQLRVRRPQPCVEVPPVCPMGSPAGSVNNNGRIVIPR